jgi:outer membrane lipoprotein-sorting protein
MVYEAKFADEKGSECRALVPLAVPVQREARCCPRANAAFVTQLAANVNGFSQYRAKRRTNPEAGAKSYRTTIADALASRPNGLKLNYVA